MKGGIKLVNVSYDRGCGRGVRTNVNAQRHVEMRSNASVAGEISPAAEYRYQKRFWGISRMAAMVLAPRLRFDDG
jgi:hypothetical protein